LFGGFCLRATSNNHVPRQKKQIPPGNYPQAPSRDSKSSFAKQTSGEAKRNNAALPGSSAAFALLFKFSSRYRVPTFAPTVDFTGGPPGSCDIDFVLELSSPLWSLVCVMDLLHSPPPLFAIALE
jgi:hypothetical protein